MIALVDCNNFYCSCERLFNPKLKGRPVVVLSNNDGCAIARSDEAKEIGIVMGTPEFMIREQLKEHNVAVFSSNYTLYGDLSDRVMRTLTTFVPRLELYSIDEAFLDMRDLVYEDLLKLGLKIRRTVTQNIGIPVTVGIAPTKTLAKMANRYAKKKYKDVGVFWAANKKLTDEMLAFTEVGDIWGVGRQYATFLNKNGFHTALDLINAPEEWIRKNMTVVGQRLLNELKGVQAIEWEFVPKIKKNICTSRSFGTLVTDEKIMQQAVANYAAACALKLRREKTCAKKVHVFIQTNQFRKQDEQYMRSITMQLDVASNDSTEIVKYALKGLDIIFKKKYNYMKCGVMVLELIPENKIQSSMFDSVNRPDRKKIMKAMDKINYCMGKDVVKLVRQGFEKPYKMRQEYLSKKYTTDINDVLTIKI